MRHLQTLLYNDSRDVGPVSELAPGNALGHFHRTRLRAIPPGHNPAIKFEISKHFRNCRGLRVYPYPRVYPTRPDPTRTRGYRSGRVDALRVRVYPVLPVKKVPKSHNY